MPLFWFRIALLAVLPLTGFADPVKVWVELRDKGPLSVSGLAWEDAPVYTPHLKRLRQAGFTPDVTLKWQNKVSGWVEPEKLPGLNRLSIVRTVEGMPRKAPYIRLPGKSPWRILSKAEAVQAFGAFQATFDTIQASALRAAVATANQTAGQGMKVSVIDADFYLGHEAFAGLKPAGRIADQWDFVSNKSVVMKDSLGDSHGAAVLSLLAGKSGTLEGLVPEAKFLLYRAENIASETYVEEDYVAAAIERSVDSGAKVISISLGYRYDYTNGSANLPYSSMNGRTRPSSLAALGAARRNVLVTVAMGNDGGRLPPGGPTISAPADADSILSVGILDLNLKACSYSSTGPTFDNRVKPEISTVGPVSCAVPTANPTTAAAVVYQSGTSFSAPVVAGIATLLRQLHPTASAQAVRLALMTTAARYSQPDSAAGYGLARALNAHNVLSISGSIFTAPRLLSPRKNPSIHLWDIRGRVLPLQGRTAIPMFWIDPVDQAAGVYVRKTP